MAAPFITVFIVFNVSACILFPVGGEIYSDIDLVYELNSNINIGFSIKNIFETQAPTFPLSPKIPRYFLLETGYNF